MKNYIVRHKPYKKSIFVKTQNLRSELSKSQTVKIYSQKLDEKKSEINGMFEQNENEDFSKNTSNKLISRENIINRGKRKTKKKNISFRQDKINKKQLCYN